MYHGSPCGISSSVDVKVALLACANGSICSDDGGGLPVVALDCVGVVRNYRTPRSVVNGGILPGYVHSLLEVRQLSLRFQRSHATRQQVIATEE